MIKLGTVKSEDLAGKYTFSELLNFLKDVALTEYDVDSDVFDDNIIKLINRIPVLQLMKEGYSIDWIEKLTDEQKERLSGSIIRSAITTVDDYSIDDSITGNPSLDHRRIRFIGDALTCEHDVSYYINPDISADRLEIIHDAQMHLPYDVSKKLTGIIADRSFTVQQSKILLHIAQQGISPLPFANPELSEHTMWWLFTLVKNGILDIDEIDSLTEMSCTEVDKLIEKRKEEIKQQQNKEISEKFTLPEPPAYMKKLESIQLEPHEKKYIKGWIKCGVTPDMYEFTLPFDELKRNIHKYVKEQLKSVISFVDDVHFSDEQLQELYKGYKNNVDISKYADRLIESDLMAVARQSLEQDADMTELIKRYGHWHEGFVFVHEECYGESSEEATEDTVKSFKTLLWLEKLFPGTVKKTQEYFIPLFISDATSGTEEPDPAFLDVVYRLRQQPVFLRHIYETTNNIELLQKLYSATIQQDKWFTKKQLLQIYLGIIHGVDVSMYAKPEYESSFMSVIRRGLEQNVDILLHLSQIKDKVSAKLHTVAGRLILKEIQRSGNPYRIIVPLQKYHKNVDSIDEMWQVISGVSKNNTVNYPHL